VCPVWRKVWRAAKKKCRRRKQRKLNRRHRKVREFVEFIEIYFHVKW
jgi:hypothetical protein